MSTPSALDRLISSPSFTARVKPNKRRAKIPMIPMNAGTKSERKQLSYPQLITCVDTIRANVASFTERGLNDDELAKELTKKCGFEVTDKNANTAKKAANVSWPFKRSRNGKLKGKRSGLVSPNMSTVAKAVLELGRSLGHTFAEAAELERIAAAIPKVFSQPSQGGAT